MPKSGKTTTASRFDKSLIFAFEKGYSAIPGIMAIPVNSWREFRNYLIDLREEETKEMYHTIVIDTADIAYDYCTDYIINQEGINKISDIAYGGGYNLVQKEFDSCIRKIIQMNYGLVLISHSREKTVKPKNGGAEYEQITPTLENKARLVCERTCDIIGLSLPIQNEDGTITTKLFLRGGPTMVAGSRFKYMPDVIDFNYENLVNAMHEAIDKEARETGHQYITEERNNLFVEEREETYDFSQMIEEFSAIAGKLMETSPSNRTKISSVVEEYLGSGRKVAECSEKDAPALALILRELREMAVN